MIQLHSIQGFLLSGIFLLLALFLRLYNLKAQDFRFYDEALYFQRAIFQKRLVKYLLFNLSKLINKQVDLSMIQNKISAGWYPRNANYQVHEWILAFFLSIFGERRIISLFTSTFFGMLIVITIPVYLYYLSGEAAYWTALAFCCVDPVNVYYSRSGFGDTMASFFLLLSFIFVQYGLGSASNEFLFAAGLFACLCLLCKTQYYFLIAGIEIIILLSFSFKLFIFFNAGIVIPFILVELFYRLLKIWGYEYKTYFELVYEIYFGRIKDFSARETKSAFRKSIPFLRLKWIQLIYEIENPLFLLALIVSVTFSLTQREPLPLIILFLLSIPMINWVRNKYCATRYFFSNSIFLLILISLSVPKVINMSNILVFFPLIFAVLVVGILWNIKYFQPSSRSIIFNKLINQGIKRIYCADFYYAQSFFPRDCVKYAPASKDQLKDLLSIGFTHWVVEMNAGYALTDEQEQVLHYVEESIPPEMEWEDETVNKKHFFYWEYLFSPLVTPKYERLFYEVFDKYKYIRVYNINNLYEIQA